MKTLAIIGTAGRGSDLSKLSLSKYNTMVETCRSLYDNEGFTKVVSGGAAWADHVAISLEVPISLWLPEYERDLKTAGYYHQAFSDTLSIDTWWTVMNTPHNRYKGFKDRNTKVAEEADCFIAMTFGDGPKVKDGGTADTVRKMMDRGIVGYHMDLHTDEVYIAEL